MRILTGLCLAIALTLSAAQTVKHKNSAPAQGIKTPGVAIPFASLKADLELPYAPQWMYFSSTILLPDKTGGLERLDAKTNKLLDPVPGVSGLCNGGVSGFTSLWIPDCADHSLLRLDAKLAEAKPKSDKPLSAPVRISTGVGAANPAVAANADSIWILSDDKTTLSRVDPDQNKIVSELRLPAGCNSLMFGESALWITCPSENRVLRINSETTLVEKRIEVSAQPSALAISEASLWVLCLKDGKIERIDPKTDKVTKTIETGISGSSNGGIAAGEGSIWVTLPGFPITRIDPVSEKVMQQFWGAGGGAIQFGEGSVWLTNLREGTLWRLDPKRILATLAE